MRDPRLQKLAKSLLEYSNKVQAGQHVLIKGNYCAKPLIKELIKETYRLGAFPVSYTHLCLVKKVSTG